MDKSESKIITLKEYFFYNKYDKLYWFDKSLDRDVNEQAVLSIKIISMTKKQQWYKLTHFPENFSDELTMLVANYIDAVFIPVVKKISDKIYLKEVFRQIEEQFDEEEWGRMSIYPLDVKEKMKDKDNVIIE